MTNLRLSEHFTLAEFERSATAQACGIDNSVPSQYIPTLQQLCKEVLEPRRRFVGGPLSSVATTVVTRSMSRLVAPMPPNTPWAKLPTSDCL